MRRRAVGLDVPAGLAIDELADGEERDLPRRTVVVAGYGELDAAVRVSGSKGSYAVVRVGVAAAVEEARGFGVGGVRRVVGASRPPWPVRGKYRLSPRGI